AANVFLSVSLLIRPPPSSTLFPYTTLFRSSVSKPLPEVVAAYVPVVGAVQLHQTERPPNSPACCGSPGSTVAPPFEAVTVFVGPTKTVRFAKLSFGGLLALRRGAPANMRRETLIRLNSARSNLTGAIPFNY